MRLPRDVDAGDLVSALRRIGYTIVRQTGSHIRLTTQQPGVHHLTVPNHSPLKLGTLSAIVNDLATQRAIGKDEALRLLFDH